MIPTVRHSCVLCRLNFAPTSMICGGEGTRALTLTINVLLHFFSGANYLSQAVGMVRNISNVESHNGR